MRQYFYLLDLDPKTRIMADENDARILADDVLTEVLERWYEEEILISSPPATSLQAAIRTRPCAR